MEIMSHEYYVDGDTAPKFVYVEGGYDQSLLPPDIQKLIKKAKHIRPALPTVIAGMEERFARDHYLAPYVVMHERI